MEDYTLTCPYCKRNDFKNSSGLTQHQRHNRTCNRLILQKYGANFDHQPAVHFVPTQVAFMAQGADPDQNLEMICQEINKENSNFPTISSKMQQTL